MVAILASRPASSTPVPRPVTAATSAPVIAAVMAADGVVLPMPMSPPAMRFAPASACSLAALMPISRQRMASSRLMAGPWAMFPAP